MKTINAYLLSLSLCFTLAIGTTGCKKSVENRPPSYYSISAAALDYLQLPVGRYFIYRDSATGDMDSVVVTSSSMEKKFSPEYAYVGRSWLSNQPMNYTNPAFYYDSLSLVMDKISDTSYSKWLNISYVQTFVSFTNIYNLLSNQPYHSHQVFWYPFNLYTATDEQGAFVHDTMTIEGISYRDVLEFRSKGYNENTVYCWAKGVGIIRKSVTTPSDTNTWTLVRNG